MLAGTQTALGEMGELITGIANIMSHVNNG